MTPPFDFPGGVWLIDFEFHPARLREGNPPHPVCLVARDLVSGRTIRAWEDDLARWTHAPFPTDGTALVLAYYASAEMGCFLALGWPMPVYVLDLFIAFRRHTNGRDLPAGGGLLGALVYFGLDARGAEDKCDMRALVLRGGPWTAEERHAILAYCESDVEALARLFTVMQADLDWPRVLLHSRFAVAAAQIERTGVPIDVETFTALRDGWDHIRRALVATVDRDFGVYEGTGFRQHQFAAYLAAHGLPWPRLPSGALDLADDTFKAMARSYPQLAPLRELRWTLSQMRLSELAVGDDGRNRCLLSMFRATTGRNQPSNARFIFGPSVWLRGLIQPRAGYGLAYVDWSQQEFGIATPDSGNGALPRLELPAGPLTEQGPFQLVLRGTRATAQDGMLLVSTQPQAPFVLEIGRAHV